MHTYILLLHTHDKKTYTFKFLAFDELEAKEIAKLVFNKKRFYYYILYRATNDYITKGGITDEV